VGRLLSTANADATRTSGFVHGAVAAARNRRSASTSGGSARLETARTYSATDTGGSHAGCGCDAGFRSLDHEISGRGLTSSPLLRFPYRERVVSSCFTADGQLSTRVSERSCLPHSGPNCAG